MEQRTYKPGDRVDRYVILGEAGRGGMGAIYQARDPMLQRMVALKVLPPEYNRQREYRERFIREAQAAGKIHHRNVVAVHDVSVREPPYIVMEYLRGETFDAFIKREAPVSLERTLDCLAPVMAAVIAAHECGVIHRDLKPANVMLAIERDGTVTPKVLDFGISKLTRPDAPSPTGRIHDDPELTGDDQQIGTPSYMAPEQDGDHRAVGPWSDAYSIALMVYLALTGKKAFSGPGSIGVIVAKRLGHFTPPSEFPFNLPAGIDPWMKRALAVDVSERFADVREMARALLAIAPDAVRTRWEPLFARETSPSPAVPIDLAEGYGPSAPAPTLSGIEVPLPPRRDRTPVAPVAKTPTPAVVEAPAEVSLGAKARVTPAPPSSLKRRERALMGTVALLAAVLCVLVARELRRTPDHAPAPPPHVTRPAPVITAPSTDVTSVAPSPAPPVVAAPAAPPTTPPRPARRPAVIQPRRVTPREHHCGPDELYHDGACLPVPRLVLPTNPIEKT